MEMVEHANKCNLMNIKVNFYMYYFNKLNKLIEEQKYTKESHNRNSTMVQYNISTRPYKRHRASRYKYAIHYTIEHYSKTAWPVQLDRDAIGKIKTKQK
jgi:hypothetical protein